MSKSDFVTQIYHAGLEAGLTDAAARVMAAQAGIESRYGSAAPGFNYFGITKGSDWTGPTVARKDHDGAGNTVTRDFRVYDSPEAGIADRIALMDSKFPGFNGAPTMADALAALQHGKLGKYYEAPQASYEKTVAGINEKYLPPVSGTSATRAIDAAVPPDSSSRDYLTALQYGHPGGGVGVNADKLDPEFSNRLSALIRAAEKATGEKVSVFEGYRDPARSAQLNADYTGKAVAYDGKTYQPTPGMKGKHQAAAPMVSEHNLGMAADIRAGKDPDKYPSGPAYDYMVAHAAEFGLENLGASDPAHFQIPTSEYKTARAGAPLRPFKFNNPDGLVPPADVPNGPTAVASELDVRPPLMPAAMPAAIAADRHITQPAPVPSFRKPVVDSSGDLVHFLKQRADVSMGDRSPGAMSLTSTLGWRNGQPDKSTTVGRGVVLPEDSIKKAAVSSLDRGLGSLADDRTSTMLAPKSASVGAPSFVSEDHPRSNKPDLVDVLKDRAAVKTAVPTQAQQQAIRSVERPSGAIKTTSQAQNEPLPANVRPNVPTIAPTPAIRAVPRTQTVANPAYTDWTKTYGTGGASQSLQDIHDLRDSATMAAQRSVPPAPPKTIEIPMHLSQPSTPATRAPILQKVAPVPPVAPAQEPNVFQRIGSFLGDQATGAVDGIKAGVNDVVTKAPALAGQAKDAVISAIMMSPKARGAIIDPIVARFFTDKPYGSDPATRYGATFAERHLAAMNRERMQQGLPPLPAQQPQAVATVAPVRTVAPRPSADQRGQAALKAAGMLNQFGMMTGTGP
jgi:hypothetical protein